MGKKWILIFTILLAFFVSLIFISKEDTECYDYNSENPNALISGEDIAGTVYAKYPEETPGLGWI